MTRGRPPLTKTELVTVEVDQKQVAEGMREITQVEIGQTMVMDAAEVFQQVGRIQGAHFLETVSSRLIAETYISIKNSKAYKGLPYMVDGKTRNISTLEEFCDAYMPRSRRRCEQIAESYQLLGPELYEQAEVIGFRQRDYSALKALPADDQAIVKQAIEAGQLDNAIELMQEMAVKHHAEKATLEHAVEESKENYTALSAQLERKEMRINDQDAEITALQRRMSGAGFNEADALAALDKQTLHIVSAIMASQRRAVLDVMGEGTTHDLSRSARQQIGAAMGRIILAVRDVAADLDLDINESPKQDTDANDDLWAMTRASLKESGQMDADGNLIDAD